MSPYTLSVPTIRQQTGWKRPCPNCLCQEWDALKKVSACDFDLGNAEFVAYAEARGVLYKAGRVGSERFAFVGNHSATEAEFRARDYFKRAAPSEEYPEGYPYTPEEMDLQWLIMRGVKGALQDCWEVFCSASGRR